MVLTYVSESIHSNQKHLLLFQGAQSPTMHHSKWAGWASLMGTPGNDAIMAVENYMLQTSCADEMSSAPAWPKSAFLHLQEPEAISTDLCVGYANYLLGSSG